MHHCVCVNHGQLPSPNNPPRGSVQGLLYGVRPDTDCAYVTALLREEQPGSMHCLRSVRGVHALLREDQPRQLLYCRQYTVGPPYALSTAVGGAVPLK